MLVASGFLPKHITTPEQAMAIAIKGVETGTPMMQSFAQIKIIDGVPCQGAENMLYLIRKNCPRAIIDILERTITSCKIRATRPNHTPVEFCFTIEDAKRAELMAKTSWQRYPRNMLYWRTISDMAKALFPDCIGGIGYTPEELGAEVNEDGQIIDVKSGGK